MKIFILIMLINGYSSRLVTVDFNSMENCEKARVEMNQKFGYETKSVCVEK